MVKDRYKDILEEIKKEIPKPTGFEDKLNALNKTAQVPAKATNIPEQMSADTTQGGNGPVVTTNNVNNIGGTKPKIVSLETSKPRNSDLYSHLSKISVPV